jgi:hypothetical protein
MDVDSWMTAAPMRFARNDFGIVTIDGKIYVFGGYGYDNLPICSAEMYDPCRGGWTVLKKPIHNCRCTFSAAAVGKDVLFCGGCVADATGCMRISASAELYNVDSGATTPLPSMAFQRLGSTAVATMDKVYVFGGLNDRNQFVSTTEVFDFKTRKWFFLPDMTRPRFGLLDWPVSAVAVENAIVVLGKSFALSFDPQTNTWSELSFPALECLQKVTIKTNSAVAVGQKIYIHDANNGNVTVVDIYTQMAAPLPVMTHTLRIGCGLASIGHDIFVVGGFDEHTLADGFLASAEVFRIPKAWQAVTAPAADMRTIVKLPKPSSGSCDYCYRPGASMWCASCANDKTKKTHIYYCNRDCQLAAWSTHKKVCKKKRKKRDT